MSAINEDISYILSNECPVKRLEEILEYEIENKNSEKLKEAVYNLKKHEEELRKLRQKAENKLIKIYAETIITKL